MKPQYKQLIENLTQQSGKILSAIYPEMPAGEEASAYQTSLSSLSGYLQGLEEDKPGDVSPSSEELLHISTLLSHVTEAYNTWAEAVKPQLDGIADKAKHNEVIRSMTGSVEYLTQGEGHTLLASEMQTAGLGFILDIPETVPAAAAETQPAHEEAEAEAHPVHEEAAAEAETAPGEIAPAHADAPTHTASAATAVPAASTAPIREAQPQAQAPAGTAPAATTPATEPEHSAFSISETKSDSLALYDRMKAANSGAFIGSKEYTRAHEAFGQVMVEWVRLDYAKGDRKGNLPLTEKEVRDMRAKIEAARAQIDYYIERKEKEGKLNWNERSKTRVAAMTAGLETLKAQEALLDARQAEIENAPAPSVEQLSLNVGTALHDMEDAEKNVHFGSKEYDRAMLAMNNLNKRLEEIQKKGPDYRMTEEEVEELRKLGESYEQAADAYLLTKEGKDLKAKTKTRVDAVWAGKSLVRQLNKRCDERMQEIENEPAKSMIELSNGAQKAYAAVHAANLHVTLGSKEYANAMKLIEKNAARLKELTAEEDDHKLTSREREELEKLRAQTVAAIDAYLDKKKGKELGPKTQMRVEAMRQAKRELTEQKKKLNERAKEMRQEAREKITPAEETVKNREALDTLKRNNKRVWRGSKQYDEALKAFDSANDTLRELYAGDMPSVEKRQQLAEELKQKREAIGTYLDYKQGAKLNDKGKNRVDGMQAAYDALSRQIDYIEDSIDLSEKKEKNAGKESFAKAIEELKKSAEASKGNQYIVGKASVKAAEGLQKLSGKKELTEVDKAKARNAIATMILRDKMMGPGGEKFAASLPKNPGAIAKAIHQMANSPEFKQAFPDAKLTPMFCMQLSTNPKTIARCTQAFNNASRTFANNTAERMRQKQHELDKQNQRQGTYMGAGK